MFIILRFGSPLLKKLYFFYTVEDRVTFMQASHEVSQSFSVRGPHLSTVSSCCKQLYVWKYSFGTLKSEVLQQNKFSHYNMKYYGTKEFIQYS